LWLNMNIGGVQLKKHQRKTNKNPTTPTTTTTQKHRKGELLLEATDLGMSQYWGGPVGKKGRKRKRGCLNGNTQKTKNAS